MRNPVRRTKKKVLPKKVARQNPCAHASWLPERAALWRLTYHMETLRWRVWSGLLAPQFRLVRIASRRHTTGPVR